MCDCSIQFLAFVKKYYENDEQALELFRQHDVISKRVVCPTCSNDCHFIPSGNRFGCKRKIKDNKGRIKQCKFYVPLKKGTFLENCRFSPATLATLIRMFMEKKSQPRPVYSVDQFDFINNRRLEKLSLRSNRKLDDKCPQHSIIWWPWNHCGD